MEDFYFKSKYYFLWRKYFLLVKLEKMKLEVATRYYDTRIKRAVLYGLKIRAIKSSQIRKMCYALKKNRYTNITDFLNVNQSDNIIHESTLKLIFAVNFYRMKIQHKYFKNLRNLN